MDVNHKKRNDNSMICASAFIDGFNLYHAIDELGRDDLKWVDLRRLVGIFTGPEHKIIDVFYFTAVAEWLIDPANRHKAYINALAHRGVTPVLGSFKSSEVSCRKCSNSWTAHEEKMTDVNIAVWLLREAYNNKFDQAFVISCDSDLAPAFQAVKELPKRRAIKLIAPPKMFHSKHLGAYSE